MRNWLTDESGKRSLMRLLALLGFVLGAIVTFSGLIGFWLLFERAVELVFAGIGLAGAGEYAKCLQKRFEK